MFEVYLTRQALQINSHIFGYFGQVNLKWCINSKRLKLGFNFLVSKAQFRKFNKDFITSLTWS